MLQNSPRPLVSQPVSGPVESPPAERVNVLLLISTLEYGGAQRQVIELANHLDPQTFNVHVCSLLDHVPLADQLRDREHRLHVIRKYHKLDFTVVPRLALLARGLHVHVLHSFLFDADIAARLAGCLARTPVVVNSERNTDYRFKHRHLAAYAVTRRGVSLVVANSNAGADFNSRRLHMDRSRYRVVHNGVDLARFRPQPEVASAVRRELGIDPAEPVVGMFASFKQQKNHALFFQAAARILKVLPQARFLLVGDMLHGAMNRSDVYKEQMSRLMDDLGIRNRCLLLGNRRDVERLYPVCDITVLSSLYEGTPNVLLESMACGIPVVATNVADNAYVVPDGRCGYVVELHDEAALADRITQLLTDADLRTTMGRQARLWVEQEFAIPVMVAKMGRVYQDALAATGD